MTELLSDITTPSDAELISSVRGGDVAAYGELFARHKDAANRLARQLVRGPDSDDLVSEAFAKVLTVLQGGGGPDVAFRAYLLTAVRRLHVDRIRANAKVQPSEDMSEFDGGIPFQDTAVAAFESGAAAKAFATLPERWQLVLWHLEVEGQKPADIAPLLGMSPNSVSALAYRAREGLRQAFLTMHLNDTSETDCRWVNEHLGAYVRKGLSNRDSTKVRSHLDQCRRCTAMYLELTEVNSNLAGIIAPLLLGGAATGYLASSGAAAGGFGLTAAFGRVRDVVSANAGAATAAGVAAGVAAVATAGVLLLPSGGEQVAAVKDPAANASSAVPTPPSSAAAPSPTEEAQKRAESDPKPEDEAQDEAEETSDDESTAEPAVATVPGPSAADPTAPGAPDVPGGDAGPQDPGPAGSVTSDVGFSSPVTFDGDAVSFTVSGDPLPPTIGLELVSDPRGIEFRENGSACTLTSDTTADCSTGALARGGFAMQRGMALAPRAFTGSIRLRIPADQPDSEVRLIVSVPKGYTDPSDPESNASSFQYKPKKAAPPAEPGPPGTPGTPPGSTSPGTTPPGSTPPGPTPPGPTPPGPTPPVDPPVDPPPTPSADLELTGLSPNPAKVGPDGDYAVSAAVAGVPDTAATLQFTITSGAATFSGSTPSCTLVLPSQVTCAASAEPQFLFRSSDPFADTPVTVRLAPAIGFDDPDATNNAADVTLLGVPRPVPTADVGLVVAGEVTADDKGTYRVSSKVTGVPTDYTGPFTFRLAGEARFVGSSTPGCPSTTLPPGDVLTCDKPVGTDVELLIEALDNRTPTMISIDVDPLVGLVDEKRDNNTGTTSLRAVPPPVDVVLAALDVTDRQGSRNTVRAEITGVPATADRVVFTLSGAGTGPDQVRFVDGADGASGEGAIDCAVTSATTVECGRVSTDGDGAFFVDMKLFHPAGQPSRTVRITVDAPESGEPDSARPNNTRSISVN